MPKEQAAQQQPRFTGSTSDVILPQVNAEFWNNGTSITGILKGYRNTSFSRPNEKPREGVAYQLTLQQAIDWRGAMEDEVELAPLTGLTAALKSLKTKGYVPKIGDLWRVTCIGIKRATRDGFSDSPEFTVDVL